MRSRPPNWSNPRPLAGGLLGPADHDDAVAILVAVGAALATTEISSAATPTELLFVPLIALIGASTMYFVASVQTMVQLGTEVHRRGRVLGVHLLIAGVASALRTRGVAGSIACGARMRSRCGRWAPGR